jgi:2'-5' RNA ligase
MLNFNQFLLEKAEHSYSSTQVNLPIKLASKIINWGKKYIPDDDLHDYTDMGRESNIHVTILFGLLSNESDEVRKIVQNEPPISLTFGKTSIFENPEFDVVKLNVLSNDLIKLNKKLKQCEHHEAHPKYIPHCTIAYVKSGKGKQYVGDNSFAGEKVTLNEILFSNKLREKTKIQLKG